MFTKTEKEIFKDDIITSVCSMVYGALLFIMFGVYV